MFPILGAPILKPNLNSCLVQFGQPGELFAAVDVWVVALCERALQVGKLLVAEGGPMPASRGCSASICTELVYLVLLARLVVVRLLAMEVGRSRSLRLLLLLVACRRGCSGRRRNCRLSERERKQRTRRELLASVCMGLTVLLRLALAGLLLLLLLLTLALLLVTLLLLAAVRLFLRRTGRLGAMLWLGAMDCCGQKAVVLLLVAAR